MLITCHRLDQSFCPYCSSLSDNRNTHTSQSTRPGDAREDNIRLLSISVSYELLRGVTAETVSSLDILQICVVSQALSLKLYLELDFLSRMTWIG